MATFTGRIALVTGGASGIGRAAALAFAREGARVVVADVSREGGEETAALVKRQGGDAVFTRCDVSQPREVEALIRGTVSGMGGLDVAFNNAGIEGTMTPIVDCTEENWDRILAVNLKSVWLCLKHELPVMQAKKRGAIVNCSSVAGLIGFPGLGAYVASKHGIIGLTRTAALECAGSGVRVNAVCPGVIRTPMVDRLIAADPSVQAELVAGEPIGRMGRPEEIAEAVLFLSSDAASFVTGYPLAVDGGWVAR